MEHRIMFNQNQINKIMKKAGRKVDNHFRELEKMERIKQDIHISNLKSIRNKINEINLKYPDRGGMICCIWGDRIFSLKNNKAIEIIDPNFKISDVKISMELIEEDMDKRYYIFPKKEYDEHKRFMDWLVNKYPYIKMALYKNKTEEIPSKEKMINLLMLGDIVQEFVKEFPGKNIYYLKEGIISIDKMLSDKWI